MNGWISKQRIGNGMISSYAMEDAMWKVISESARWKKGIYYPYTFRIPKVATSLLWSVTYHVPHQNGRHCT
jgi:hypothetical protein